MSKARLLKVNLQVVLVVEDDDGDLTEQICDPITLSAKQWPEFAAGGFDEALNALRARLEGPPLDLPA